MSDENTTPLETPAIEPVSHAPAPEPESPFDPAKTAEGTPILALEQQAASQDHLTPVDGTPLESTPIEATPVDPEAIEAAPASAAEAVEPAPKKKRAKKTSEDAVPVAEEAPAEAPPSVEPVALGRKWYVVKIQSGREETIKAAVERKVRIEGLEEFFGRIEIPAEEIVEKKKVKVKVKDKKTGEEDTVYQEKNVTKKRKKYPGYLFAEVDFNDRILYLFRETPGVGDFVGATLTRAPNPMPEHEVQSMLTGVAVKGGPKPGKVKVKLDYEKGDKIKIRDGAFSGMEGEVKSISEAKDATETPKVKVEVTIFGRPVEVELDYWQVDKA